MTEFTPRDLPQPKWKLIGEPQETSNGAKKVYHVKLAQPHITRLLSDQSFREVEYVHVNVTHKNVTDSSGSFIYNETLVSASDEDGGIFDGYLYMAHRALELPEALFAIGEV